MGLIRLFTLENRNRKNAKTKLEIMRKGMYFMNFDIVKCFDIYLLILTIVSGLLVAVFDSRNYRLTGKTKGVKQSIIVGCGIIIIVGVMFIIRNIVI